MQFKGLTYVAAVTVVVACSSGGTTGGLDVEQSYTIALSAGNEVPTPKTTIATGTAEVVVYPTHIDFQINAANMSSVTMAHIHNGAVGVAGPVVVTLFAPGTPTGTINGVLVSGSLTSTNLPSGVTLESLKALLLSGNAYINVHTVANPGGEIRGQLK